MHQNGFLHYTSPKLSSIPTIIMILVTETDQVVICCHFIGRRQLETKSDENTTIRNFLSMKVSTSLLILKKQIYH